MNRWKYKRKKSGISDYNMAYELNIPYKKYLEIERGEVKMPSNLIDKFNQIIHRGTSANQLSNMQRDSKVNEWFEDVTKKVDDKGKLKLKELMNEYNISTYAELASLCNISKSYLSTILTSDNITWNIDKVKNKLYDFFHNELNIQPVRKKKINSNNSTVINDELISWWKDFDIEKFMSDNNIDLESFSKELGMSQQSVYRWCNYKSSVPYGKNIIKIKEFVENYKKNKNDEIEELKEQLPELPTEVNAPIKHSTITVDFHNVVEQIKKDDIVVEVIKSKIDSYLNNLEGLEYEIVKLNEQIDERKKEVQLLTSKKDALVDILNDLESGE